MIPLFLKNFSLSTILGLAFGILLAGYAVFAFNPPTQAPPGGNVPAPLNTGSADQTKTGGLLNVFGLWVNQSLGVSGGASIGGALTVSGQPVCLGNGTNCPPSGVPAGFVGYFNLSSCPSGWSALAAAQGRYLVGLPSAGTLAGTAGAALSNLENRPTGNHFHQITQGNDAGGLHDGAGNRFYAAAARAPVVDSLLRTHTGFSTTHLGEFKRTDAAGAVLGDGTNAPYIQFLVCQKN